MFNRFYAFGCSFTHYIWPTWADIIAKDLAIPSENWGKEGAGNQMIASKIVECDFTNHLTKDDLAIVVWSGWNREDRFLGTTWHPVGTIFNNSLYDIDFIDKYWSIENDYIKNSMIIHTIKKAYKECIKFHGAIMLPDDNGVEGGSNYKQPGHQTPHQIYTNRRVIDIYYKNLDKPVLLQKQNGQLSYNNQCSDSHPDILSQLYFVQEQIYPAIGLTLKQSTIDFCKDYYARALTILDISDTREKMVDKIQNLNSYYGMDLRASMGV